MVRSLFGAQTVIPSSTTPVLWPPKYCPRGFPQNLEDIHRNHVGRRDRPVRVHSEVTRQQNHRSEEIELIQLNLEEVRL